MLSKIKIDISKNMPDQARFQMPFIPLSTAIFADNTGYKTIFNLNFSTLNILCFKQMFNLKIIFSPLIYQRVASDNPFPHNNTFCRPWETSRLKTLREKEKLLVTSNFSFSHSVFYPFR